MAEDRHMIRSSELDYQADDLGQVIHKSVRLTE